MGWAVLVALALLVPHLSAEADKYEVYAVRFATLANFPVSSLIAGADRSRRMDIAMMIWVLKGADGRIAIVDGARLEGDVNPSEPAVGGGSHSSASGPSLARAADPHPEPVVLV